MEKLQAIGQTTTGMKKRISTWAKGVGLRGNMSLERGSDICVFFLLKSSPLLREIFCPFKFRIFHLLFFLC